MPGYEREPRVIDYILLVVLAMAFGLPTWFWYDGQVTLLFLVGFGLASLFGIAAVVEFFWLLISRWVQVVRDLQYAYSVTKESRLAETMKELSPDSQRFLLDRFKLSIERHLTPKGEVIDKLGTTGVPMEWFVNTFLQACNGEELCPIGRWSENSINRSYAKAVTDYLVDLGLAITNGERNGNKPAHFAPGVNQFILLRALGYETNLNVLEELHD